MAVISIQRILATALRHDRVLVSLRRALTSTLITANPYHRQIITFASTFWDQHKTIPKPGDFEFWISTLDLGQQEGTRASLNEITSQPTETWTPEYITTEVTKVLKETAARNAVARLGTMVPAVPTDALQQLADEIQSIEPVSLHGLLDLEDVERWVYQSTDEEPRISTGFPSLDRYIGGFSHELVFIMADTGLGKTSLLINLGAAAMLKGSRVFHLTFELSAENTLRRYFRRISEIDANKYRSEPQVVIDRVRHWLKYAKGTTHILYQGAYTVGPDDLKALVDQYADLHGGVDLLVLDYLDLMKSPNGFRSEYEALGQLSHMVRNLCDEYHCTVISATQASRISHRRRHLRLDTIGDSYRKAQAADIVLGLVQSDEEFDANQARIGLLKVRENPGRGVEVPVYCNLDLMLIADLDHPNTQRIIKGLNQPSTSVFRDEPRRTEE